MGYGDKKFGPYKSSLIPYTEEIIKLRYMDNKTYREIKEIILEKYNINVAPSTIMDFLKVRERRKNPKILNDNLRSYLSTYVKQPEPKENIIKSDSQSEKTVQQGIENILVSKNMEQEWLDHYQPKELQERMITGEFRIEKWMIVFPNGDKVSYEKGKQFVKGASSVKLNDEGTEIFTIEDLNDCDKATRMTTQEIYKLDIQRRAK